MSVFLSRIIIAANRLYVHQENRAVWNDASGPIGNDVIKVEMIYRTRK